MHYFWEMKAVISGATRGIGKAIAQKLVELGYDLVLLARNEEELERCKLELSNAENQVQILSVDLSLEDAPSVLATNAGIFKNTTLLVNNLGVYSMQNAANLDLKQVQAQINVNLYSAITLTQQVLEVEQNQELKNIVNIASVMSLRATSFATDYSISKHAFKAWNDGLREELRAKGKKVSAIYPGSVNTSSWDGIEVDRAAMIQAEDIAEMVACILAMKANTLLEEIHVSPTTFTN